MENKVSDEEFESKAMESLKELLGHPDVRTVVFTVDRFGTQNDNPDLFHGGWASKATSEHPSLDSLVGTMKLMLANLAEMQKLLDMQMAEIEKHLIDRSGQLLTISRENKADKGELDGQGQD